MGKSNNDRLSPFSSKRSRPAFATIGSFDALTVDDPSSSDSAEEEEEDQQEQEQGQDSSLTSTNQFSTSTKKGRAKQRARDRARKALASPNKPTITPSTTHTKATSSDNKKPKPESLVSADHQRSSNPQSAPQKNSGPSIRPKLNSEDQKGSERPSELAPVSGKLDQKVPAQSDKFEAQARKTEGSMDRVVEESNRSPEDCETLSSSTSDSFSHSRTTSVATTDYEDDGDDNEVENPGGGGANSSGYDRTNPNRSGGFDDRSTSSKFASYPSEKRSAGRNGASVPLNQLDQPPLNTPSDAATPRNAAFGQTSRRPTTPSVRTPNSNNQVESNRDETKYGADHAPGKKWKTVATRVVWSLVMVSGFIGLMTLGHVYLIVLVFIIQLSIFREVSNLFEVGYKASAREHARKQASSIQSGYQTLSAAAKERKRIKDVDKNRWSKVMSWYFFCAVNYFLYGESIIYYFKHIVFIDAYLLPFARHHRFISLLLYLVGFLAFVANLDRGHLRRQFGLFSWIHMSLLLIVASGQFMVNNILEGLIWFWIPASLVIMNDVAAYVFGMLFGKHQLIKLSPKKTVEGFIGGYFTTVIFSVLWGSLFMGWNYMICPVRDLGITAFSDVQCVPNNVFVWRPYQIPPSIINFFSIFLTNPKEQIMYTPFQLHCLVLGTFAGLVAPFGGFFASGFKRAFNIKDFADTIPGHGGLTDRFDCQFIMGLFTYFYYTSMVREQRMSVGSMLEMIASSLKPEEQFELYKDLGKSLVAQGFSDLILL